VFINGFSFTEATLVKRSLESFFGIGASVSQRLMAKFYIHPWAKVGSLKNATVMDLTAELANMKIENDLRRQVQDDIRRLRDMGTYRGRRHAMGLPVRGQKTRTQVCGILRLVWIWLLMAVLDFDRTTVEQDGAWRNWQSVDVRWESIYECIILYSMQAWNGVYNTQMQRIPRHEHHSSDCPFFRPVTGCGDRIYSPAFAIAMFWSIMTLGVIRNNCVQARRPFDTYGSNIRRDCHTRSGCTIVGLGTSNHSI
jgi:small subunit ribosomal protein S13